MSTDIFFFLKTKLSAIIFTADAFWSSNNIENNNNKLPMYKKISKSASSTWTLMLKHVVVMLKKVVLVIFFFIFTWTEKIIIDVHFNGEGVLLGDKTCVHYMLPWVQPSVGGDISTADILYIWNYYCWCLNIRNVCSTPTFKN